MTIQSVLAVGHNSVKRVRYRFSSQSLGEGMFGLSKMNFALVITAVVMLTLLVLWRVFAFEPSFTKEQLNKYINSESKFAELRSGAVVHYRDQGNPNGPVIALVHGQYDSLHVWEPWIKELSDEFRLITMDQPGHGLTGRIPGDYYSRGSMAKVLRELMDYIGIEKFVLVGNSMGGGVATYYTIKNPDHVVGLILIGAGGATAVNQWPDEHQEIARAFRLSMNGVNRDVRTLNLKERLAYKWPVNIEATRGALQHFIADDSQVTDELVQQFHDLSRYEGNRFVQAIGVYHYYAEVGEQDLLPMLPDISAPTLLLWGTEDVVSPIAAAKRFDEHIPNSKLVVYDQIGHMCQIEIPERSANDVRNFVQSIPDFGN